jgi:hypothetical protein
VLCQPGCKPQSKQCRSQLELRGNECKVLHHVLFGPPFVHAGLSGCRESHTEKSKPPAVGSPSTCDPKYPPSPLPCRGPLLPFDTEKGCEAKTPLAPNALIWVTFVQVVVAETSVTLLSSNAGVYVYSKYKAFCLVAPVQLSPTPIDAPTSPSKGVNGNWLRRAARLVAAHG